jgi:hypothetical protein
MGFIAIISTEFETNVSVFVGVSIFAKEQQHWSICEAIFPENFQFMVSVTNESVTSVPLSHYYVNTYMCRFLILPYGPQGFISQKIELAECKVFLWQS